ncbi:MAG: hypothetical protein WC284_15285 [Candidimonas sp.]
MKTYPSWLLWFNSANMITALDDHKQIESAFIWSFTEEGHDFWNHIHQHGHDERSREILEQMIRMTEKLKMIGITQTNHQSYVIPMAVNIPYVFKNSTITLDDSSIIIPVSADRLFFPTDMVSSSMTVLTVLTDFDFVATDTEFFDHKIESYFEDSNPMTVLRTPTSLIVNGTSYEIEENVNSDYQCKNEQWFNYTTKNANLWISIWHPNYVGGEINIHKVYENTPKMSHIQEFTTHRKIMEFSQKLNIQANLLANRTRR